MLVQSVRLRWLLCPCSLLSDECRYSFQKSNGCSHIFWDKCIVLHPRTEDSSITNNLSLFGFESRTYQRKRVVLSAVRLAQSRVSCGAEKKKTVCDGEKFWLTDCLYSKPVNMFVHRKRSGRMFIWKISGNRWSVYLFSSGGEIQLVCSLLTGSLFMATTNVVLYKSPALNPSFTTVWGGADTINRNTSPYNALQFNSATNYYLQNDC